VGGGGLRTTDCVVGEGWGRSWGVRAAERLGRGRTRGGGGWGRGGSVGGGGGRGGGGRGGRSLRRLGGPRAGQGNVDPRGGDFVMAKTSRTNKTNRLNRQGEGWGGEKRGGERITDAGEGFLKIATFAELDSGGLGEKSQRGKSGD